MKIWVDMTASAHVLVFRPLIGLLQEHGDEVEITSRDYAQTLQLLELHGLESTVIGRHGGRSRLGKARSLASRLRALRRWAKQRDFDLALAHGSHELTLSARGLGIPSSTTLDYEFAPLQHHLGLPRRHTRRLPRGSTGGTARPLRRTPAQAPALPGHQGGVLPRRLRARPRSSSGSAWTPPDRRRPPPPSRRLAVPPAFEPALPADARPPRPRRPRARDRDPADRGAARVRPGAGTTLGRAAGSGGRRAEPDRASDLVVSAGGTMNREAVALGVPVYTTYGGRLGGVDELLIREGQLVPAHRPAGARPGSATSAPRPPSRRRDPRLRSPRWTCFSAPRRLSRFGVAHPHSARCPAGPRARGCRPPRRAARARRARTRATGVDRRPPELQDRRMGRGDDRSPSVHSSSCSFSPGRAPMISIPISSRAPCRRAGSSASRARGCSRARPCRARRSGLARRSHPPGRRVALPRESS